MGETAEHPINRLYRQDISIADLFQRGQTSNYRGKPVVQGSFHRVSTFCLFGIQAVHHVLWAVTGCNCAVSGSAADSFARKRSKRRGLFL